MPQSHAMGCEYDESPRDAIVLAVEHGMKCGAECLAS
jgi:hypothetical protein